MSSEAYLAPAHCISSGLLFLEPEVYQIGCGDVSVGMNVLDTVRLTLNWQSIGHSMQILLLS